MNHERTAKPKADRRTTLGEPHAGKPPVRFDEGRCRTDETNNYGWFNSLSSIAYSTNLLSAPTPNAKALGYSRLSLRDSSRFSLRLALTLVWMTCLPASLILPLLADQPILFNYDGSGNLNSVNQNTSGLPAILAQPAGALISADSSANAYFSVVAVGPGPLSYQWLSNGVPLAGMTGDALALPGIALPPNLISNGGFESPEITALSQTFTTGTNVGGWVVESGDVALVRSSQWGPYDGLQSLDLNSSVAGAVHQDVPTLPGQQYILRFEMAGYPFGAPTIKTNQVWWGTNLIATVPFNITGTSSSDMGWTNHEYFVTASSNSTRVRFVSLASGPYGPALDAVSLTAVGPPAANYSVIVSNAAGSITSSVVNVQFDTDNNGLADSWERAYFGAIGQDPNADSDGDGVSNFDEYLEGTNPTNAASFRPRLHLAGTPGGAVTVSPFQLSYALNDTVQLAATPDANALFEMWTGGVTSTNPVVNLVMNGHKTVTGLFGLIPTNGATYSGTLAAGTSNRYAFVASAGDSIQVRAGAAGFTPRIDIFGPDGSLAGQFAVNNANNHDADVFLRLTNSGAFFVVVGSQFAGGSGAFTLSLAQAPEAFVVSPGHSGGTLTNGANNPGVIGLGGQDMWCFTGSAGDSIQLRVGAADFTPRIDLYGPDGSLAGQYAVANSTYHDASVFLRLTNSGSFTVVVSSYFLNGLGNYSLSLAQAPEAFVVSPGDSGGTLTNGANNPGVIGLGGQGMWRFTGSAGDSVQLRVGAAAFTPRIDLYGPDGSLAGQFAVNNATYHDADLFLRLTNSGTFTVVLSSYFLNGSGDYNFSLAQAPESFVVSPGDSGGALTNGANNPGVIGLGGQDMWSLAGNAGDSIQLRVGAAAFTPRIDLYGPDGSLAGQYAVANGTYHDAELFLRLTNSGSFTVVVSSYFINGSGTYAVSLAQAPEAFVVSPGDSGGTLTNGANNSGVIGLGGQDMWRLTCSAGDSIQVRVGAPAFTPRIDLYGPDGALAGQFAVGNGTYHDAYVFLRLTNSGSLTAVVSSYFINGSGNYNVSLAQAPESFVVSPGHAGGTLTNGAMNQGTIALGEQDMWTFTGNAGDSIQVRMGTDGFDPRLDLYGPDGALAGEFAVNNGTYMDGYIFLRLTNSGRFTLVASSYYVNGAGNYSLNLAQAPEPFVVSPGDEGGVLTNGAANVAILDIGDQDMWSFAANAGDSIQLRVGTAGFTPRIDLYGPSGALAGQYASGVSASDAWLYLQLTNSGTFVAVISSYSMNGSGMYDLNLAQAPEAFIVSPYDEGGPLTNGGNHDGVTTLGDEDLWTFTANAGDGIVLRCGELSGTISYSPNLRLYGPSGALLATDANASDSLIAYQATNSGKFTLMLDSLSANNTGSYRLRFMHIPGAFVVPPGDEGGTLTAGTTNDAVTDLGDEDIWNFTAFKGLSLSLSAQKLSGTATYNPWIRLYSPTGAPLTNASSATTATINYAPTNSGVFTLLVGSFNRGATGTYRLTSAGVSAGVKLSAPVVSGTNVSLAGSGGLSNLTFVLTATTNVALPTVLWTPILTNHFDASGAFVTSNLFNPAQPARFFRLSVP
jgi:choice-of-anchor C domain-containing protein